MLRAVAFCAHMRAACSEDGPTEPCPFTWTWSSIAKLRGEDGSDTREECSSPACHKSLSDDNICRSSSSMAASDSGHTFISDDDLYDVIDHAEPSQEQALPQSQLSHSPGDGHAASEADIQQMGCMCFLGDAAACESQPSHADSSHSSSIARDDHAHDSPQPDASIAAPGSGSRLREAGSRLYDTINALPHQRQQLTIDLLQDLDLDLSTLTAMSVRRLRKDVKATCMQVSSCKIPPPSASSAAEAGAELRVMKQCKSLDILG